MTLLYTYMCVVQDAKNKNFMEIRTLYSSRKPRADNQRSFFFLGRSSLLARLVRQQMAIFTRIRVQWSSTAAGKKSFRTTRIIYVNVVGIFRLFRYYIIFHSYCMTTRSYGILIIIHLSTRFLQSALIRG